MFLNFIIRVGVQTKLSQTHAQELANQGERHLGF